MNIDESRTYLWVIVAVTLASVLAGALLVGCGGGEPPPPTAVPPTPTPSASDHMALGLDHRDRDQLDEAVAEFKEAIRLDPEFVEAHYNLGLTYHDQGKFELAVAEHQEAIGLAPDLAEAHNGLGMAYYGLGRLDEAIAAYQEAVELDTALSDAHFNLGHAYSDLGQHEQALAAYQGAARLAPDDHEIHHNIGVAYIKQGLVNEAIEAWETAADIDPDFAETHYALGLAYIDVERFAEAVDELNEVLRLEPDRDRAYKHLGVAHYALGQDEEAVEAFETYLRLQPDDPDKATIEATIAELQGQGAAPETGAEYRNAPGGYSLRYPEGLLYVEDDTMVTFAPSQAALELALEEAVAQGPVVMFDASPVEEVADDLDLAEGATPEEFLEAMVEDIGAEMGKLDTGELGGYSGALAEISGTIDETAYAGGLAIVIVEDRVVGAYGMAPPDQWTGFRPTFEGMFFSLSFFEPE